MTVGVVVHVVGRYEITRGAGVPAWARGTALLAYLRGEPGSERISNAFEDVIAAAWIKARYPISCADAFAVATATKLEATVVTGDPEFQAVSELVPVDWIR